jgi:hypothetical protein
MGIKLATVKSAKAKKSAKLATVKRVKSSTPAPMTGQAIDAWLAYAAVKAAAEILAITGSAPQYVRDAILKPHVVDLAIVARLDSLLNPATIRAAFGKAA